MPLMEATLTQTFQGVQTVNRWNYLASGTPAAVSLSFGLASAMGAIATAAVYPVTGLLWKLAECQDNLVTFQELVVKDVYNPFDFYSVPFIEPLVGQDSAGEALPPFAAWGFRTTRTRLDIRRATKRFIGVPEDRQSAGQVSPTFLSGELTDLANAMTAVVTYDDEGQELSYAPVVVSKHKYEVPDSDPVRYAYEYYDTLVEQEAHLMSGMIWSPYATVRGQASRQFGHGS